MIQLLRKVWKNEHGFSMLELLVYIGIVGVIAAFAVPRYTNTMAMANTEKFSLICRHWMQP